MSMNKTMKKTIVTATLALIMSVTGITVFAAGGDKQPELEANIDVSNKDSLQRGLKNYMNYCFGCHSLKFSRYNRVAKDLGVSDEQIKQVIFTKGLDGKPSKVGDLMKNNLSERHAKLWFGTSPPDLSLIARVRGSNWIYSYLNGFYRDDKKRFQVNNLYFPDVGMPHVLIDLEGEKRLIVTEDEHGHEVKRLEYVTEGELSPVEYKEMARDITNFLAYVAEPVKAKRQRIGIYVMLYLAILFIFAYFLKKEFWREIH